MTDARSALSRFLKYDQRALEALRELARNVPEEISIAIREFLLSDEPHDYADCLIELLSEIEGSHRLQLWIRSGWSSFSPQTRHKIIYPWSHDSRGMPTNLAVWLFENDASTVVERHLLVAGLAVSASRRGVVPVVAALLPRIGRYDNSDKQRALESFQQDVARNLAI